MTLEPVSISLSPTQEASASFIGYAWPSTSCFHVWSSNGLGRSTVLRFLHEKFGGVLLSAGDLLREMKPRDPQAIEEVFTELLIGALDENQHVFVDDIHVLMEVFENCQSYPRTGFMEYAFTAVVAHAVAKQRKLVLASDGSVPVAFRHRALGHGIEALTAKDYSHLALVIGGQCFSDVDFEKVYRFAPKLDAYALQKAFQWLAFTSDGSNVSTSRFLDYLRSQELVSNVSLNEVSDVALEDLKGVDDVVKSLYANIVLPMEDDELSEKLDLKPKRGVLLLGPPGTGKTTVGKALAHRLRGKFFLVDGTVISGTDHFFFRVNRIFQEAKDNAPSVIFIDDCDVLFENRDQQGLYRYLLTMLDGLEGNSSGRVCVIMTAMDVSHIPRALVRSGRIELWLEMKMPNLSSRKAILAAILARWPALYHGLDIDRIAASTEEFTGADLKRIMEDGKNWYAYSQSEGHEPKELTEYFMDAITKLEIDREKYRRALDAREEVASTLP